MAKARTEVHGIPARQWNSRAKLVKLLSRNQLESCSSMERPHLANRESLEAQIILGWKNTSDDVRECIDSLFAQAEGAP